MFSEPLLCVRHPAGQWDSVCGIWKLRGLHYGRMGVREPGALYFISFKLHHFADENIRNPSGSRICLRSTAVLLRTRSCREPSKQGGLIRSEMPRLLMVSVSIFLWKTTRCKTSKVPLCLDLSHIFRDAWEIYWTSSPLFSVSPLSTHPTPS